jgi:phage gp36-like protein
MGYCTYLAIQADFKSLTFLSSSASPTSLVTQEAVTQFINEASALIDSYVGQRWVTPITADATALALMSLFCRTLVADRVRGILANKQQTNTDANAQVKSDGYSVKDVMKALIDLKNGDMQLSGAMLLLGNAAFYSNNNQNSVTPRFSKNRRQW